MDNGAKNKNQKKREKKREANMKEKIANSKNTYEEKADPVVDIKAKLAEAKASGDTKLAAKLRQDLWILQDVNSGIDPGTDDKKAVEESLERLANHVPTKVLMKNNVLRDEAPSQPPQNTEPPYEKELRKLNKKLRDIENLKGKQENGTVLESTQIDKISKEEGIRDEIRQLQEMMSTLMKSR